MHQKKRNKQTNKQTNKKLKKKEMKQNAIRHCALSGTIKYRPQPTKYKKDS